LKRNSWSSTGLQVGVCTGLGVKKETCVDENGMMENFGLIINHDLGFPDQLARLG